MSFATPASCPEGLTNIALAARSFSLRTVPFRRSGFCGVLLLILAMAIASPAQTYKVLYNVSGDTGSLIQGPDGNLWGPIGADGTYGYGDSIIKMTPAGKVTTVYTFCALANCADGQSPSGLVLATDGNFYGVTDLGGSNSSIDCDGEEVTTCGTVFRLTPSGTLTTIYNFCTQSNCTDGSRPTLTLIQGSDGYLYGQARFGGSGGSCYNNGFMPAGCGTIFKISLSGALTTLYSFCVNSCVDGNVMNGNLIQAPNGLFFGSANSGGTGTGGPQCDFGCGTIFDMTGQGTVTSLYNFCIQTNCPDGSGSGGSLVLATNGLFYGTTNGGGAGNDGTVYSFDAATKALSTLHSFCSASGCPDGNSPGGLIQASDGNFYGYTSFGGANSSGTLFKITPAGGLTTLYNFCSQENCFDGDLPGVPLLQATSGIFYGMADGGNPGNGVIYSLTVPGIRQFVRSIPVSGKVGSKVTILGYGLTGATAVTFNGTAATFTVVSATQIKTTVPTGATTGELVVTTSTGKKLATVGNYRIP